VPIIFDRDPPVVQYRKILVALDKPNPTRADRSNAYVFAVLAFICTLLKVSHKLLHLSIALSSPAVLHRVNPTFSTSGGDDALLLEYDLN
jgi:hypothetical protein